MELYSKVTEFLKRRMVKKHPGCDLVALVKNALSHHFSLFTNLFLLWEKLNVYFWVLGVFSSLLICSYIYIYIYIYIYVYIYRYI